MTFEKYFKPKIDWKFFNYLQYAVTEFEDMGYIAKLTICVVRGHQSYNSSQYDAIFSKASYESRYYYEEEGLSLSKCMDYYDYNGLFYCINIRSDNGDLNDVLSEKFYKKISNKCVRYSVYTTRDVVVKPK